MTALEKLRTSVDDFTKHIREFRESGSVGLMSGAFVILAIDGLLQVESALRAVEDEARWVPVEERLPHNCQEVIVSVVVFEKPKVSTGWLEVRAGNQRVWCLSWGTVPVAEETVTHWRPLPEGPKEGAQESERR